MAQGLTKKDWQKDYEGMTQEWQMTDTRLCMNYAWLRMYLTHLVVVSINTIGCEPEFLSSHHLVYLPSLSLSSLTQVASGEAPGEILQPFSLTILSDQLLVDLLLLVVAIAH